MTGPQIHSAKSRAHRNTLAPGILSLYESGSGHKTIAKQLGLSPNTVRRILIERGVWKPGSLHGGAKHRKALSDAGKACTPAWKREEKRRADKRVKRIRRASDLPLFKHARDVARKPITAKKFKERYATDREFQIMQVLRKRLNKVAKRGRGYGGNNLAWLGCTPIELLVHIEAQWTAGMAWSNYGCKRGQWSIDHKRPCASFDLLQADQRRECFHFSNLQPMWHADNIAKSDKWDGSRVLSDGGRDS